ncbi:MAG: hypothetical protein JXR22_09350 [Prolixibacteraceae bacterium]|nr:hypothetical protein [Prolixibacteraceae bacterium]
MKFKLFIVLSFALSALLTSCEEVEITGNWVSKPFYEGIPRGEGSSFGIDNKGYFGMGRDDDDYLSDFWMFDPEKNTWMQVAEFPGETRAYNVSVATNNKGYVGLGYNGSNDMADFWEYNPANNQWKQIEDFPGGARRYSTAFSIGDDIYVGTGTSDNDKVFYNDFYKYSNGNWSKIATMSGEKRRKANAVGMNGKGYLLSGIHNGTLVDFYSYDPATDTWTKLVSLNDSETGHNSVARTNACVFVSEGKLYMAAGNVNNSPSTTVFEWDPATEMWSSMTDIESASGREGAGSFVLNDKGYIVGGRSGSAYFDDFYMFEPSEEKDSDD